MVYGKAIFQMWRHHQSVHCSSWKQLEEWKEHGKEQQYQGWSIFERGQNPERVLNFNSQTYQIIECFWNRNNLICVNVKVS